MSSTLDETHIQIEAAAYPWQHVRKVGEDLVAHEMVLPEKTEVTPYAMGALVGRGGDPAVGPAAAPGGYHSHRGRADLGGRTSRPNRSPRAASSNLIR